MVTTAVVAPPALSGLPHPKILLLEDSPTDACLVRQQLEKAHPGYFEVVVIDSLERAVARVTRETFHAVLLDINLSDNVGFDTIRLIRGAAPRCPSWS